MDEIRDRFDREFNAYRAQHSRLEAIKVVDRLLSSHRCAIARETSCFLARHYRARIDGS